MSEKSRDTVDSDASAGQTAAEARAEYEAQRQATRVARQSRIADAFPDGDPGPWVGYASIAITVIFAIATGIGVIDPEEFIVPYFVITVGLFALGCVLFMLVIVAMALRSRDDVLSVAGVFFLSESAPPRTRAVLLGSLVGQIVIGLLGAALRPFTPLAVGTMVPLVGLALVGLWAVRYGYFPAHPHSGSGDL